MHHSTCMHTLTTNKRTNKNERIIIKEKLKVPFSVDRGTEKEMGPYRTRWMRRRPKIMEDLSHGVLAFGSKWPSQQCQGTHWVILHLHKPKSDTSHSMWKTWEQQQIVRLCLLNAQERCWVIPHTKTQADGESPLNMAVNFQELYELTALETPYLRKPNVWQLPPSPLSPCRLFPKDKSIKMIWKWNRLNCQSRRGNKPIRMNNCSQEFACCCRAG